MVDEDKIQAEEDISDEEIERASQDTISFKEKARMAFNRANVSRYLGFFGVVTATIVISLYQVGWDPWKIGWQTFIANTMVLLFLGTYGIFFGEAEGTSFFKKLLTGLYQKIKYKFEYWVDRITREGYIDSFPDYITWRYQKDCEHVFHMKLLSVRVFDDSILDLNKDQLLELREHPIEVNGHPYSMISEEQYNAIIDIIDGKVFVDYIDDYNFYIMETANDGVQQVTKVKQTDKRKEKISWKQRISRLLMIVIVALIFAGFFKKSYGEGGGADQTSMIFSRLTVLLGSIASGINTARLLNLEDIYVLEYKASYDKVMYYSIQNKSFVPVDYLTKAQKELDEYKQTLLKEKKEEDTPAEEVPSEDSHQEEIEINLTEEDLKGESDDGSTDK